jgi:hypothetical protein
MSTLTQCRLQATDGENLVSWIPTKSAKVGNTMIVEDHGDKRFTVLAVHDTMDEKYVKERSADYRTQRRASDV